MAIWPYMGCPGPLRAYLLGQSASSGNNILTVSSRSSGLLFLCLERFWVRTKWAADSLQKATFITWNAVAGSNPTGTLLAPSVLQPRSYSQKAVRTYLSTTPPVVTINSLWWRKHIFWDENFLQLWFRHEGKTTHIVVTQFCYMEVLKNSPVFIGWILFQTSFGSSVCEKCQRVSWNQSPFK